MKVALLVKINYKKFLSFSNQKHPKQNAFVFIHCWLILKDVPRWSETREENKKVITMKRKVVMDVGSSNSQDKFIKIEINIEHVDDYNERKVLKWL